MSGRAAESLSDLIDSAGSPETDYCLPPPPWSLRAKLQLETMELKVKKWKAVLARLEAIASRLNNAALRADALNGETPLPSGRAPDNSTMEAGTMPAVAPSAPEEFRGLPYHLKYKPHLLPEVAVVPTSPSIGSQDGEGDYDTKFSGDADQRQDGTKVSDVVCPVQVVMPDDPDRCTFADVAGQEVNVARLLEICDWLRHPEVYDRHGAKLPKGALLDGPPGTGKTLLVRALAGQAGVPMLITDGSSFVQLYVGVGAARVRDLFDQAEKLRKKTKKPVIIFIDEVEAVGGKRGNGPSSNSERDQTLNALLTKMDGFKKSRGILVIAATNRPDMLDEALKRKGRFDIRLQVDLPDTKARRAIFMVHLKGKLLADNVDLDVLAKRTSGMSGADIAAACNQAATIAARRHVQLERQTTSEPWSDGKVPSAIVAAANKRTSTRYRPRGRKQVSTPKPLSDTFPQITAITMEIFDEAISVVRSGEIQEATRAAMSADDRRQLAVHELGHAVAILRLGADTITKVTALPRGRSLGSVSTHTERDKFSTSDVELKKRIIVCLAGRAAQKLLLDTADSGAADDFEQATRLAQTMVTKYGMSKLGMLSIAQDSEGLPACGPELANQIDQEVRAIMQECLSRANEIVQADRAIIEDLCSPLIERETIQGPEFARLFAQAEERLKEQAHN